MKVKELRDTLMRTEVLAMSLIDENRILKKLLAERLPYTETATASWSKTLERRNK
jgi:hypothetical protein